MCGSSPVKCARVVLFGALAGCQITPESFPEVDGSTGASAEASSTGRDTSSSSDGAADEGGDASGGTTWPIPLYDVPPPSGGTISCSKDLRSVLDEFGHVVQTCGPDEGCLEGQCVEACKAAGGSDGSIGCEFFVPTPAFYGTELDDPIDVTGPCHALMVANPWPREAALRLRRGADDLDIHAYAYTPQGIGDNATYTPLPKTGLAPGEVAIVFLAHRRGTNNNGASLECPLPPAVERDTAAAGNGGATAFRVLSDTPIQVYDILPFGGAATFLPSASLLYPTSALGTNYIVASPHTSESGAKWLLVVAAHANTEVTIAPRGGFLPGVQTFNLARGKTQQFITAVPGVAGGDASGTVIESDKPVAVFVGNTYLDVQTADPEQSGRDASHQQLVPVRAMGHAFVGPGLLTRLLDNEPESVRYRVMAAVDNTTLQWDPPLDGVPETLMAGEPVEFETRELFSVRAQNSAHPIALMQYMSGGITGQHNGCIVSAFGGCYLGDDEFVMLGSPEQFLRAYSFFVDPTYGTSSLVFTRVRDATGAFHDVELECMGTVENWEFVGVDYQVAHVELFRYGVNHAHPPCASSQHRAYSDHDFGVVVWGQDNASSYGYPAGGNLGTVNNVVIPAAG